jgi:pyruvate-formate lyase-activating enzyme
LTLWWSRHLYTPFDQWLDQTSKQGREWVPSETETVRETTKKTTRFVPKMVQRSVFHRRYVMDDKTVKEQADSINKPLERRVLVSVFPPRLVRYYVPTSEPLKLTPPHPPLDETAKRGRPLFGPELISLVVRLVTLNAVDNLIEMEYRERKE